MQNNNDQYAYAFAKIKGNAQYHKLEGLAYFYPIKNGTLVEIEVNNMPLDLSHPYALHIHEGNSCEGQDFELSKGHFNPTNVEHPKHAGDLPPLFSNNGYSYMLVYTDRFRPVDVIDKTVIIHDNSDDFKTQPSGNSGNKIACGVIEKLMINY